MSSTSTRLHTEGDGLDCCSPVWGTYKGSESLSRVIRYMLRDSESPDWAFRIHRDG